MVLKQESFSVIWGCVFYGVLPQDITTKALSSPTPEIFSLLKVQGHKNCMSYLSPGICILNF